MNAFAYVWGAMLPLRWYMAVLLGQAARGIAALRVRAAVRCAGRIGRALFTARVSTLARAGAQSGRQRADAGSGFAFRPRRAASAAPLPRSGGACSPCAARSSC